MVLPGESLLSTTYLPKNGDGHVFFEKGNSLGI